MSNKNAIKVPANGHNPIRDFSNGNGKKQSPSGSPFGNSYLKNYNGSNETEEL